MRRQKSNRCSNSSTFGMLSLLLLASIERFLLGPSQKVASSWGLWRLFAWCATLELFSKLLRWCLSFWWESTPTIQSQKWTRSHTKSIKIYFLLKTWKNQLNSLQDNALVLTSRVSRVVPLNGSSSKSQSTSFSWQPWSSLWPSLDSWELAWTTVTSLSHSRWALWSSRLLRALILPDREREQRIISLEWKGS